MKGVYLKIRDPICIDKNVRVSKFIYSIDGVCTEIPKYLDDTSPADGFRFMKCKFCGHHDFREDGINSYNCNGCDAEITVLS